MKCQCGEVVDADQVFCRQCGRRLIEEPSGSAKTRRLPTDEPAPTAVRSSPASPPLQAGATGLDTRLVIGGLAALAILAGLAGFAIWQLGDSQDEPQVIKIESKAPTTDSPAPSEAPGTAAFTPATLPPSSEFSRNCGGNLQTNSVTTCPFGRQLAETWTLEGTGRVGLYQAVSPVTGSIYDMYCSGGNPVECREVNASDGTNDAAVRFLR